MKRITEVLAQKTHYIFDFDGTLVDLEDLNINSFKTAFSTVLGIDMSVEDYKTLISGSGSKGGVRQYLQAKNLPMEGYEEIVKLFRDTKNEIIDKDISSVVHVKPGVTEFLEHSYQKGIKMGIGTSSVTRYIEAAKNAFGWQKYFEVVVSADDVENVKPAPDIFLLTMQKLGGTTTDTLIFEDSGNGVEAARRSGMEYLILHTPGYNDAVVEGQENSIKDYRECIV